MATNDTSNMRAVAELRNGPKAAVAVSDDIAAADLWLLCKAGSHCFALPMCNVIETMRTLPIETIASAPPIVLGLCVIRGMAVPVIDTARLFGGEAARYERLVTVRTGERIVAFAASAVLAMQSIEPGRLGELPPLLRDADAIAAVGRLDEDLVFFLHAARAMPDDFLVKGDTERVES